MKAFQYSLYKVDNMENKTLLYSVLRKMIEDLREKDAQPSAEVDENLWNRIKDDIDRKRKQRRRYILLSAGVAAACLLLLAMLRFGFFPAHEKSIDYLSLHLDTNKINVNTQEILLITDDESKYEIKNNARIAYKNNGTVQIDKEAINTKEEAAPERKTAAPEFNSLIVPKGRRTQLFLADGSHLWVNSNSRIIYPSHFDKKRREIFVEGEIYIEVKHNETWPFVVKTSHFDVQVYGTSFNVCTYKEEEEASVVLAEGHVKVKDRQNNKVDMLPNEYVPVVNGNIGAKKTVDVQEYISWTKNFLILNQEPLEKLFSRIERYYGITITYTPEAGKLRLTGKLDIKEDNIEEIMQTIASTLPIKYEIQQETINISINPLNL